ncbi:hypothetical protein [Scytonema sp. NUACC26]|uniref:hypothetical protein n=1 Tax=Scytonema sp. NUACC26 TaxID=3140176 RepID=UPI0034DCA4B4
MTIILGTTTSLESTVAREQEAQTLKQLEQILRTEGDIAKIVGANGEQIEIPDSLRQVFHYIVQASVKGEIVSIIPENYEMSFCER